jgi:hypothetical protein
LKKQPRLPPNTRCNWEPGHTAPPPGPRPAPPARTPPHPAAAAWTQIVGRTRRARPSDPPADDRDAPPAWHSTPSSRQGRLPPLPRSQNSAGSSYWMCSSVDPLC